MVGLTVVLLAVIWIRSSQAGVFPRQTSVSNSSATSSATPSLVTPSAPDAPCCFVVQDTIEARYWPYFSTSTWYGLRNIITLQTSVTQFIDTAVTNYYTTSTLSNTSYVSSWDLAGPQIPRYNSFVGLQTATKIKINGTATVVAGVTVQSPQAFYVYSTVAVFHVPAVTDTDGRTACATTSTDSAVCSYENFRTCSGTSPTDIVPAGQQSKYCKQYTNYTTHLSDNIFPGINTFAEGYFELAQYQTSTLTPNQDTSASDDSITSATSYTYTNTVEVVTITFSTPFVYQPLRGLLQVQNGEVHFLVNTGVSGQEAQKRALTPALTLTSHDGAVEDFGYVPQTLIDWMAQNPDYAAQYPGLKDCLPGGPPIMAPSGCGLSPEPGLADPVPALTVNEAQTVRGEGCYHPGACPTAKVTGEASVIQASPAVAAFKNEAQPTQTPAPSSEGVDGVQMGSTPLRPSGDENSDSGMQSSPAQQESPMEDSLLKDQPVLPSSSGLANSPIPIIPPPVDQTTTSVTQPQPQPQPQDLPIPDNGGTDNNPPSDDQSQDDSNTNNSPISGQDGNQVPPEADAPLILSSSHYILDTDVTVTPGGPALTISGTTYSVPATPTALIINNTPKPVNPAATQPDIVSAIMAGFGPPSAEEDEMPDQGGQTLLPGGPAVTVSGTVYPVATSNAAVLVNGITSSFPPAPGPTAAAANHAPVIPGGLTLIPGGGAVTISGTVYSAPTEGAAIVINSSNSASASLPTISGTARPAPGIMGQPALVLGSQTLVPGSAITVSGTVVSLPIATASAGAGAGAGNEVVVGGHTQTLAGVSAPGVEISVGATVVSASFVQPAVSAGAGIVGGSSSSSSSSSNGTGTAVGGNNSSNEYTGPGFTSGARRRRADLMWSGLMISGVITWRSYNIW